LIDPDDERRGGVADYSSWPSRIPQNPSPARDPPLPAGSAFYDRLPTRTSARPGCPSMCACARGRDPEAEPVRVALVGLGDIARKAYLPVLAADPDVDPVLVTRDPAVRTELGRAWRAHETYEQIGGALATGIDAATVHTATPSHRLVVGALLEAGVPTLVDKPLADSYDEASRLVELADRRQVGLMVGFNRRYAPAYREVALWPDRDLVVLHKHRRESADDPRRVVFDDFIHVVDTLRYLVGDGQVIDISTRVHGGLLHRVLLHVGDDARHGIGSMDRESGTTQEVLEVSAPGRRRRIAEMAQVVHHEGGVEAVRRRDEWVSVAVQRGFSAMCAEFVQAVRSGRRLMADDALESHRLCEQIVTETRRHSR
jgi:virulence factor